MARKKKSPPVKEEMSGAETMTEPQGKQRSTGRLLSTVQTGEVRWLEWPWIPQGMVSLIVGQASVGKSTFLATIMACVTNGVSLDGGTLTKKGRVALLPGYEETVEVMTKPRLVGAGVDQSRLLLLDEEPYGMIRDREHLVKLIGNFGATLVVIDPIDSYFDEGLSEDRGQDVRPFLEAVSYIGKSTGAAMVAARHPGKDRENICPGSRQWRAVPRSVVQLSKDDSHPPKYTIKHNKDSLGTASMPQRYELVKHASGTYLFKLAEEIDRAVTELESNAGGPTGRYKLTLACKLLHWYMREETSPTRQGFRAEAAKQGLGEDTQYEAMRLLGVDSVQGDTKESPWKLVRTQKEWPKWLTPPTPP